AREGPRDRGAGTEEHRGISRDAGDAAADLRDRYSDWRSGNFFRLREGRADRRDARCDARRHPCLPSARGAFRRAAARLTSENFEYARQFSVRPETPCELQFSATTSRRFGPCRELIDALLAS